MGDTTKVIGQQEVGRCPGWRHHPWNSVNGSFAITGSNCIRWSNSAPGTASVGRPATSGSIASRTVPRDSHGHQGVTNAGTIRLNGDKALRIVVHSHDHNTRGLDRGIRARPPRGSLSILSTHRDPPSYEGALLRSAEWSGSRRYQPRPEAVGCMPGLCGESTPPFDYMSDLT